MTLLYLCGSQDVPHGGVRVAYQHVDLLNRAGIPACVVHGIRNFRCTWFENSSKVTSLPLVVKDDDVLVIPENWSTLLTSLAPGVPKVSFNQSAFYVLRNYPLDGHPYVASKDLMATMTVSQENLELLEYAFPQNLFQRIHLSVDPTLFHLPDQPPDGQRLAYMTRKRPDESRIVLDILRSRDALRGWDVLVLDRMPQSVVAATLRSASLFLSFLSQHEGCALSPLEAIASGCSVIGYTGFGAREYFGPLGAISVLDSDVVSFAHEIETWLRNFDAAEHWPAARSRAAACLSAYSQEQEEADVVSFWRKTLSQMPKSRGVTYTIRQRDLRKGSLRGLLRRTAPIIRVGMRELAAVPRTSSQL